MSKVLLRVVLLCSLAPAFLACAARRPVLLADRQAPGNKLGPLLVQGVNEHLRLSVLAPGTVRLLFTRSASTRVTASFAVDAGAQRTSAPYALEERAEELFVRTEQLGLRIHKKPLSVALLDTQGRVLAEQAAPIAWHEAGLTASWQLQPDEQVYGLGDKVKGFDRRGQAFELWNTDAYGFKPDADPLYKSIPFLVFLNGGHTHGMFVDSPARARLDVGKTQRDVLSYAAQAGEALDLYWFAGPEPQRVVGAYGALTGRMPLPPRWALGYHQSRYGYLTEQEVRGVATRLRSDAIPTDTIWLDIDYQQDNAPFTVNGTAFPDLPGMVRDFAQAGLHTVLITDPHIKSYQGKAAPSGYAPYDSGAAGDHFLREANGGFVEDKVWPGASVFPEFTLSRTRTWWGGLYRDFVAQGVAGFWNDMNEPAVFSLTHTLPVFVRHRFDDGTTLAHSFVHNAYGGLNARATYEGVRRLRPGVRPFVLTRAAYAGTQRYAATWTGDNSATREHLALSIGQLANLGVSGYTFSGVDAGGFVGCPDAELLVEWLELAALQPFFRNHSAKDACRREPWVHGAAIEARIRAAIDRRYRLLPYLYTLFEAASRDGLPVLRPLWFEYPADPASQKNAASYLLGADLLVAAKLIEGNASYEVQLPRAAWYDTESGTLIPNGGSVSVTPGPSSVHLFARAGAIIPQQPLVQHTAQVPNGPLQLDVWPGPDCKGSLYLDDGETFAYESGTLRRISYRCEVTPQNTRVTSSSNGSFPTWWPSTTVIVHGVKARPKLIFDAAGNALAFDYDQQRQALKVSLPGASADWSFSFTP